MFRIKRLYFALLPVAAALAGTLLLMAAALIPTAAVEENTFRSAAELSDDMGPLLGDDRMAYIMDYNTDALIIMESYTLSSENLRSVFLNPMRYNGEDTQRRSFAELCGGEETNNNYVRYWMGFRIFIRPLLCVFSYSGICWILSLAFFLFAFAAVSLTQSAAGLYPALCLGSAIALINPAISAHSPQFAGCFLLGFSFCAAALKRRKDDGAYVFMFCLFGALTQYFDFYTAPVVTLGLPLILILEAGRIREKRFARTLAIIGAWLYGYVMMWICKLALTTVFTDVNGFYDGFGSFFGRVGIRIVEGSEQYYNGAMALKSVWSVAFPGSLTVLTAAVFGAALIAATVLYVFFGGGEDKEYAASMLVITLLPFLWYAAAAQPSNIHAWFQYRGLAVVFFGAPLYIRRAVKLVSSRRKPEMSSTV